jgi:septum formation protein
MLVLASASPRRKELLQQAGYSFETIASSVPEEFLPGEDPIALATRLAREKAIAVYTLRSAGHRYPGSSRPDPDHAHAADAHPGDPSDALIVLGADTVVVAPNHEILGKPADAADAARMLRLLSGGTHHVITGICCVSEAGAEAAAEVTSVSVYTLSDDEIEGYIATGEPMDKAGAYAIQGRFALWIPRIQGCYFNVVGLPLALASNLIEGTEARLRRSLACPG